MCGQSSLLSRILLPVKEKQNENGLPRFHGKAGPSDAWLTVHVFRVIEP